MKAIERMLKTKADLVLLGGEILFNEDDVTSSYHLLAGEVLILRNGQVVDLVEAGEVLDAAIWNGVTAVAWTECILQELTLPIQTPSYPVPSALIDMHLALSA